MSVSTMLDTLRKQYDIKSDAALARELEVQSSVISKLRSGSPLGATMILRIHEYFGMPVAEIRALVAESAPQQYHDKPAAVSTTAAHQ